MFPATTHSPDSLDRDSHHDLQRRAETLAAAIELQSTLDRCHEFEEAGSIATRLLSQWLQAEGAVLCWRNRPGAGLKCISDHACNGVKFAVESSSSSSHGETQQREALAAAEEACLGDGLSQVAATEVASSPGTMAMRQWLKTIGSGNLMACPLADTAGENLGVLLVLDPHEPSAASILEAFGPLLSSKLQSIQRLQPTGVEASLVRGIRSFRATWQRATVCVVAAVILLMFLPAHHNIRTNVQLQPVQRRFIAAPFDGPLQECLVRPGDTVKAGELLAKINPRELEYELAGLRALHGQADQERRGSMATHDFGKSQIAAFEADRLKTQTELLNHRKNNLEIRSPIDGIIVSGDWKQSEGAPLTRGETLFEIAPVGAMKVEIEVPEKDIAYVGAGMRTQIHTHAMPDRVMHGAITRIHPAATLRDSENVFLAEVTVDDQDGLLRPGMKGRATIYGNKRPIGWIVFHRPWNLLLRWLGV
ncbi:membrane-fusion protein [Rhodopirellula islandica]|uniref:Membrane-fusion protein n=1 Tax=Rhodopirellula islandica TaxID=595434 RepID=A0A0J1E883_RHOIS|nr:HlyD family efflux transporter periplasmic adaptor subunit [Rhodopirellula islandica]KLU01654.1 membrane-fusion protein [Rhodopirellula islandica]